MDSLKVWNIICCLWHFLNFIAALILAISITKIGDFRMPLQTSYVYWNKTGPATQVQEVAQLPFAYVTVSVPLFAAFAHLWFAISNTYISNLLKKKNPIRWLEYAFSSSIMFVLIALLFGIYDLTSLITLFTINAVTMYFGYLMEILNTDDKILWHPFIVGCFLGAVQWGCLFSTLSSIGEDVPNFVWALTASYAVLYGCFALNMFWYFSKFEYFMCCYEKNEHSIGPSNKKFRASEKVYMILSLVSKTLLLWLIFFGALQPSRLNK